MKTQVDDKIIDELRRVILEAEDMIKHSADRTGDKFESIREKLQDSLTHARKTIEDAETVLTDNAKRAARAADDYVHDKPWQSIGFAAAAGLVVGMLISRR